MDPRLTQARRAKLAAEFDAARAMEKLTAGAPLAEALEISPAMFDELRNKTFELVASGHLERAKETLRMLVMLGETGPAIGVMLAACLAREAKNNEARALAESSLAALPEDRPIFFMND